MKSPSAKASPWPLGNPCTGMRRAAGGRPSADDGCKPRATAPGIAATDVQFFCKAFCFKRFEARHACVRRASGATASLDAIGTRSSGRVGAQEALQLITIGQFTRLADHAPRNSHELLDRSLQLLLADKLTDEAIGIAHRIDITRTPERHEGISGQFDHSPRRIDALIAAGESAAIAGIRQPRAEASRPALACNGEGCMRRAQACQAWLDDRRPQCPCS